MRKAKAHLEFNLAKEVKDNKKRFFWWFFFLFVCLFFTYVISKRKTMENVGLLLSEVGAVVTGDAEEVEMMNTYLASVFTSKTVLWSIPDHGGKRESLEKVCFPHG